MTRHLFAAWDEVERKIRRAGRIAFFTDFDGTLTPIRRDAGRVQLGGRVRHCLARLAAHGVLVGIVSGRSLDDVRRRVRANGLWYAGDHGFLIHGPRGERAMLVTRLQRARITMVTRRLRHALRQVPGVTVEAKGATVAVHYRRAGMRNRHLAAEIVGRIIEGRRGLRLLHGKRVWEVLPAGSVDKSTAIQRILRREGHRAGDRWLTIYVGDDVADERVFATWRGVSVAVGHQPHTAARFYVRSPAEVRAFLQRLEIRTARTTKGDSEKPLAYAAGVVRRPPLDRSSGAAARP